MERMVCLLLSELQP